VFGLQPWQTSIRARGCTAAPPLPGLWTEEEGQLFWAGQLLHVGKILTHPQPRAASQRLI